MTRPSVRVLLAAGALAALAAAPAHAQSREDQLLHDAPVTREGCRVDREPRDLPSFDQIADSAAVMEAVRAWAASQNVRDADQLFLLVSLGWNRGGERIRSRNLTWMLPAGGPDALNEILVRHLRDRRGAANLRIRIAATETPGVRVGRAEVCPPLGLEGIEMQAPAATRAPVPSQLRARVVVGAEGQAIGASLLRSSGDRDIDDMVIENLNRRRYSPGLIDGRPAEMEYDATIRFRTRG